VKGDAGRCAHSGDDGGVRGAGDDGSGGPLRTGVQGEQPRGGAHVLEAADACTGG
jgi:hypothetical protein